MKGYTRSLDYSSLYLEEKAGKWEEALCLIADLSFGGNMCQFGSLTSPHNPNPPSCKYSVYTPTLLQLFKPLKVVFLQDHHVPHLCATQNGFHEP